MNIDYHTQLMNIATGQLEELQRSGYIISENKDNEVAVAINATAYAFAIAAQELLKPEEYILVDGKFIKKSDVIDLEEK